MPPDGPMDAEATYAARLVIYEMVTGYPVNVSPNWASARRKSPRFLRSSGLLTLGLLDAVRKTH